MSRVAGSEERPVMNGHAAEMAASLEEGGVAAQQQYKERSVGGGGPGGGGGGSYSDGGGYGSSSGGCFSCVSVPFLQKVIAEIFGTYFLIFAGCASVTVNLSRNGAVTFPGICVVWGLVVMVMVYSLGHISGAHFNPAVTIAFATSGRFPWRQVPPYVLAQVLGGTLASGTLRLLFGGKREHFAGTVPSGSDWQSLALEFIITFYLMFVISGVATDNRAIGELAGLAVGSTVLINVLFAGPISGASMNPARTLGPAIVGHRYDSIWVYMVGPICGAIVGAWAYNIIRFTNKPIREIVKSGSFLRTKMNRAAGSSSRNGPGSV